MESNQVLCGAIYFLICFSYSLTDWLIWWVCSSPLVALSSNMYIHWDQTVPPLHLSLIISFIIHNICNTQWESLYLQLSSSFPPPSMLWGRGGMAYCIAKSLSSLNLLHLWIWQASIHNHYIYTWLITTWSWTPWEDR